MEFVKLENNHFKVFFEETEWFLTLEKNNTMTKVYVYEYYYTMDNKYIGSFCFVDSKETLESAFKKFMG